MELAENGDLSVRFFLSRASSRKNTRTAKISMSLKFGRSEEESSKVLRLFMPQKSSTEIWNQPIFSLVKITFQKLATWTFQYSSTKTLHTHRQEHPTMQVQRFGTMILTVLNAISGLLGAFFTRCVLSNLHSRGKIWMRFTKKFSDASMKRFRRDTLQNWRKLSLFVSDQDTEGQISVS